MKKQLNRFFSIFMAVLLLASTVSWSVSKHYCMGHLVDVALFGEPDTCGMDRALNTMDSGFDEKSCCTDQVIVIDGQDDLKITINNHHLDQQFFLIAFAQTYNKLFEVPGQPLVPNKYYPPPLLVKDIQLLDEVFLI